MGWRVSFFKADKENPIIQKKDDFYDSYTDEINGVRIFYDFGTDSWIDLQSNPEFKKEIRCLLEHPDCDYYSITKEGLKMMIEDFKQRAVKYLDNIIAVEKNPSLRQSDLTLAFAPGALECLEHERREWISGFNTNLSDDNPFLISSSWSYRFGIFDLIALYKNFDWDNYTLVVYGG